MSLRARLLLGLLVLAAAGLITLAAITYAEQRSFLLQRVDQEAQTGIGAMSRTIDYCAHAEAEGLSCSGVYLGPGFNGSVAAFPPGTFGERRGPGAPTVRVQILKHIPPPNLPSTLPLKQLITVGSTGGGGVDYCV